MTQLISILHIDMAEGLCFFFCITSACKYVALKFGADILVPQRIKFNELVDPVIFPKVPPQE